MAACANAIKYALAYKDFDLNVNYPPCIDNSYKFVLYPSYWKYKVEGYRFQDQIKHRDYSNNVSVNDFEYFKQLLESSVCAICGDKFTVNNKPTLDRINNNLPHTKDNVQPCCLYCNKYCSDKDKNICRLFIQLRRFCMLHCLPTNLTNIEDYKLIRNGVTGGLSNVMHRENIAGKDTIKQFKYEKKKVHVQTSLNIISHIVGVDFNSLYPSVMSSESHKFIKYTGGKMYMAGSVIGRTDDKTKIMNIIGGRDQLFIAELKGHIGEKYINDFINFPPILRNYTFTTNEDTIGSYMYNHMKNNGIKTDQKQRKLTNLLSTQGEFMSFSSYYLWFLIDDCHFIIDDVKQLILFNKHEGFNPFVKEFIGKRIQAKIEGNKGLEQFCKITMNSSYGSDGMNTEKYTDIKILDKKGALKSHLSNTFMDEQQLSDNAYAVQMNPETCTCKTPLQEAYFVLDNAKYWYLNFIYNFMYKAFDMEKMHFVEGDTDSAYWAVSGSAEAGHQQQFNFVIKDKQFYEDNAKYFFPTIENLLDEKKILGLAIENEGTEMIALAPKNYYIKVGEKEKIKLKGVNQKTTKISKQNIVDNINSGTITKAINMRLGQKNYIMSKIATEKNGITGIHTKMIVLKDQSCCPYIFGLKASDYIIDE
ncbi:MAG: hypothetical protein EZS28_029470 [Streblomastix strix]|uniref:DNA-directed DNA polymerase n=1 Tax=Streblomastix strix TaxID=222440 RepID=A0A5J4UXQ6_9EUKA|nr:MAG: hypothetical protein EZS28_029470 [Streblomastix strix]